ncbi:hypothetical protein JCM10207_005091 [Rhodosporidiobolus poonsookiae]
MPRLEVAIGPDRFHLETAWVNHANRPTEIDTPAFAGRVLVLVRDFSGVTADGSAPKRDSRFFEGRSRKFAILIEGRFKHRDGVEPYTGDEIQFGSDFDFLPESWPTGPFNAGMKIARWVDPATYFVTKPPNGRPYIMSPYTACMNTFCAYPSPDALSRAVVLSHHDAEHPHHAGEEDEGSFVPFEEVDPKHKWHERAYWRFVGLKGDPQVDAFLSTHSNLLPPATSASSSSSTLERPSFAHQPSSLALGTIPAHLSPSTGAGTSTSQTPARSESPAPLDGAHEHEHEHERGFSFGAPIPRHLDGAADGAGSTAASSGVSTPAKPKKKGGSRFSLSSLVSALDSATGHGASRTEQAHDHLLMADQLRRAEEAPVAEAVTEGGAYKPSEAVAKALGPWRFGDESVDAMEDSTFIFLDPDHPRSVAQRRKHFVEKDGANRKAFRYDPDLIYTASFFTPFADLNTFDIKMGPVNINIAPYFTKMPIRYTLRSTRMASTPNGSGGVEEEVFATISFRLVD